MDHQTNTQGAAVEKLLADQKKLLHRATIAIVAVLVLVGALLIAVLILAPRAAAVLQHMEDSLVEIDTLVNNANSLVSDNTEAVGNAVNRINSVDFEGLNQGINNLVTDADKLVADNTQAVSEAVEKINNIDFQRLNQAINDLADVVEPLAKLRNIIG